MALVTHVTFVKNWRNATKWMKIVESKYKDDQSQIYLHEKGPPRIETIFSSQNLHLPLRFEKARYNNWPQTIVRYLVGS